VRKTQEGGLNYVSNIQSLNAAVKLRERERKRERERERERERTIIHVPSIIQK